MLVWVRGARGRIDVNFVGPSHNLPGKLIVVVLFFVGHSCQFFHGGLVRLTVSRGLSSLHLFVVLANGAVAFLVGLVYTAL